MATLVKTRRRINSISNTRKVTNAMELVASVKFKRFKNAMSNGVNYVDAIKDVMAYLASELTHEEDVITKRANARLIIVVNSNLGLCANYNNDLFKMADNILKDDDVVLPIGLKGAIHFKSEKRKMIDNYVSLNERVNYDDVEHFAEHLLNEFNQGHYSSIHLIYMDYLNSITFKAKEVTLLPVDNLTAKADLNGPLIEPDADTLYQALIPIYMSSVIYQAIVTSQASEQAARRNAMENATDNADEILDKLKLEYNKARQSAITQEIAEVTSGAND